MSGSIRLHKDKGVNPKMTFCRRCGKDANELILVGADEGKYKCDSCVTTIFGYGKGICPKCGHKGLNRVGKIGEHERLPATQFCDECKDETAEHQKVVEAGGVHFRCKDCGAEGVVKAGTSFAVQVRQTHQDQDPNLQEGWYTKPIHTKGNDLVYIACGVEMSKGTGCPQCQEKAG